MIKQLVPEEVCLKCRGCCRFLSPDTQWAPGLLNQEIAALAKETLPACLISSAKRIIPEYSQLGQNYLCPLLSEKDNQCKIYSFRPFECQLYPFIINRSQGKVFLAIDLNCSFVEENLKTQEFASYLEYLSAFLKAKEQKLQLKNNPHIIQAYPGVKNLFQLILE